MEFADRASIKASSSRLLERFDVSDHGLTCGAITSKFAGAIGGWVPFMQDSLQCLLQLRIACRAVGGIIISTVRQHRPDNARTLVGERAGSDVGVSSPN